MKKYKQPIWISNEVGMQEYGEPFKVYGKVGVKQQFVLGATQLLERSNISRVEFEPYEVLDRGITSSSHFWLHRTPDPDRGGDDFTHVISPGFDITDGCGYTFIDLKSVVGYNPFVTEES